LDFLRGIALLVVLIDHIEDQTTVQLIRPWMPVSTCFFDGAEAFVFLSGLVFGRTFQRRLEKQGFLSCQLKAVRRAIVIYLTYLLTALVAVGIGLNFSVTSPFLRQRLGLQAGAGQCLLWSLPLCYQPWGFPILAVYALALPLMPLFLLWQLRSPRTAWIVPFAVYVAAQSMIGLQLPRFPWGSEWTFNPFAWQFLFFIGMTVGVLRSRRIAELDLGLEIASSNDAFGRAPHPLPVGTGRGDMILRIALFLGASAVFVFGLGIRNHWFDSSAGAGEFHSRVSTFANEWSQKTPLGPVRIVHFLSLAYLLAVMLPNAHAKIWQSSIFVPLIKCGQHSLAVYAFGVILMFVSIPVFQWIGESSLTLLIVEFDCFAISICLAYVLDRFRFKNSPSERPIGTLDPNPQFENRLLNE